MKKLIALTGSFNPVTVAHYRILSDAVERFHADEGVFIATDDRYLTRKVTLKSGQKYNFILPERTLQCSPLLPDEERHPSRLG